jgi:hypothetical protein
MNVSISNTKANPVATGKNKGVIKLKRQQVKKLKITFGQTPFPPHYI